MFDKLARLLRGPSTTPDPLHKPLAIAVLLAEAARADFDAAAEERAVIRDVLAQQCGLDGGEAQQLVERAFKRSRDAISLHDYLQTLNAELDQHGKSELLLWLWRVAFADGRIDPHEELRIRQIADLLYVPHREFVRRRLQAEQESTAA